MATVKPAWLDSVEHVLTNTCSTPDARLWIACSGGIDSCVLLHITSIWAAKNTQCELGVIHINHQLSPNADHWQQFVEQLATHYEIKCVSKSVSVVDKKRLSLESQARDARYKAIFDTLSHNDTLLLGQHLDDQVETVFLRLLRGSGPKGLAAIRQSTQRKYGDKTINLIRPLLSTQRSDIELYARQESLNWVYDESNDNQDFDRNMLRHHWLKSGSEQWPERWAGMKKAISRSALLCDQQQSALDLLLAEKTQTMQLAPQLLSKSELVKQPQVLKISIIRYWLSTLTDVMPSVAVMEQIIDALNSAADKSPVVNWGEHELRVHRNAIYFLHQRFQTLPIKIELLVNGDVTLQGSLGNKQVLGFKEGVIHVDGKHLVLPSHLGQVDSITVVNDLGEYYFKEGQNGKSRQLKRWFKDWKIPPWYRLDVTGVFVGNYLFAVIEDNCIRSNQSPFCN